MSTRRPTGLDVALGAGVSPTTVSYVLNGAPGARISDETRARVLAVAERLGYTQNAAARTLQRGHSSVVLFALPPWPLGPPVAEAVSTMCREVSQLGYTPLVFVEQSRDSSGLVRASREVQPVAVIAPSINFRAGVLTSICGAGTRAVISYGDTAVPGAYSLIGSQQSVGARAAEYLVARGHRDILGVVLTGGDVIKEMGRNRSAGARQACRSAGVRYRSVAAPLDPLVLGPLLDRAMSAGHPGAIYAFNDETAFMVIRLLAEAGYKVPQDVAVIGCDDSPAAALFQPSVTSVRSDWTSLAEPLQKLVSGELLTGTGQWLVTTVVSRTSA